MSAPRQLRLGAVVLTAALLAFGTPPDAKAAVVPTITAIAAGGEQFTCALTSRGGVKCWGSNQVGQLGDGSTTNRVLPVDVSGLATGVAAIAAGSSHACVLTVRGGVKCWGNGYSGQLGRGSRVNSTVPVDVSGLTSGVTAISAGFYHTCALTNRGAVACWGLDFGGSGRSDVPVVVPGLAAGITAVAAGVTHSCALTEVGGVKCWGINEYGQLGNGTTGFMTGVVDVSGLTSGIVAIATGQRHSCALTGGGSVKCWGSNAYAQLGVGSPSQSSVPVSVAGPPTDVTAIAAGYRHTCALRRGGRVTCWGQNAYGQLGNGARSRTSPPVDPVGLASGVTAVSAGDRHSCAVISGGRAMCWGINVFGQLGTGSRSNSNVPVEVDFATHQTIAFSATKPSGTLPVGTAVTFTATVAPLEAGRQPAVVRFEIYRQDGGVWRRTAHRDVITNASGRATLRWTFVTSGLRFVRAIALANSTYAASPWSARVEYRVVP